MAKMASIHADQTTIPTDYLASFVIHAGNNLDILPTLPDNSVDSIVTDPPYELGFMGKKWDNSGIAYSVELWTECLRVLKPGGHLLAFSGSRTYHRMVVAIEDAGFDVRDMISWISNKTFPKSLDVSKAIDKGTGQNRQRQLTFTAWMRSSGLSQASCAEILQPFAKNLETAKAMAQHYFSDKQQPAIATADIFDSLRPYLPEVPEAIERLVAERTGIEWIAYKNRKVIGQRSGAQSDSTGKFGGWGNDDGSGKSEYDITAPSTPEAQKWQGWGTGLKPTVEPIVMARKPLSGTVAANVLEHGTGALNIDGSRIGTGENRTPGGLAGGVTDANLYKLGIKDRTERATGGRWPANVILDEYSAAELDSYTGHLHAAGNKKDTADGVGDGYEASSYQMSYNGVANRTHNDSGGASRFFYCAKASKRDRNEGLEGLEARFAPTMNDGVGGKEHNKDTATLKQNFHPTVKPTTLMRYLVKLVTPPGGTVLDPFTGSGSTGKAAILEGFDFIGIELTEEYLPIIDARLKHAEQVRDQQEQAKDEGLF
jgi:DNA modification methylase